MLKMTAISNGGSYSNYMTGAEGQKADYYMQSEELKRAPEWVGEGAKELGLQGEVKTADLQAVLAGNLPNGEQLGRAAGDGQTEHRAGWDGTFSAPKSVSVAALVGGDQRLSDAHATAVREALQHIEKHKLETRVTTGGVTQREQTGSMVAAVFQHAASRASDPQLHSHALIANATKGQDGKWRSVESLSIYQDIKGLGQVYRETLAREVRAAGYEINQQKDGSFEIRGVPGHVIDQFSKRSEAIERDLASKGLDRDSAKGSEKDLAALETRSAKAGVPAAELEERWRKESLSVGFDAVKFVQQAREQATPERREQIMAEREKAAADAVKFARQDLAERSSVFTGAELREKAGEFGRYRTDAAAIDRAISAEVKRGDLTATTVRTNTLQGTAQVPGFTTREAAQVERSMLKIEERGRGAASPLMTQEGAREQIKKMEAESGRQWNAGQKAATLGVLTSGNRVVGVQGLAGTAKTTTVLKAVSDAAKAKGERVVAIAPTTSAAKGLGKSLGTQGKTVAKHLADVKKGQVIDSAQVAKLRAEVKTLQGKLKATPDNAIGKLQKVATERKLAAKREQLAGAMGKPTDKGRETWVVDEAGMIGAKSMEQLLKAAEQQGARVVLAGDTKQLASVEAGRAFGQLQEHGMQTAKLDDIVRQTNEATRAAVYDVLSGKAAEALDKIANGGGRVIELANPAGANGKQDREAGADMRRTAAAAAYLEKSPEDRANTVVLDPTKAGRDALTEKIRDGLKAEGALRGPEVQQTTLEGRGLTIAAAKQPGSYRVGDQVAFGKDYQDKGVSQGEFYKVQHVDTQTRTVVIQAQDGRNIEWKPEQWGGSKAQAYEEKQRGLAVGDQIRFTQKDQVRGVQNGDRAVVTGINQEKGTFTVQTKEGRAFELNSSSAHDQHWRHSYVDTAHALQGETARSAIVVAESDRLNTVNREMAYVGASRATTEVQIVTDNAGKLADAINNRSGVKASALDAQNQSGREAGAGMMGERERYETKSMEAGRAENPGSNFKSALEAARERPDNAWSRMIIGAHEGTVRPLRAGEDFSKASGQHFAAVTAKGLGTTQYSIVDSSVKYDQKAFDKAVEKVTGWRTVRHDSQQREPEQRRDGQQGKPEQTPQRDQEQRREPAQERQGQQPAPNQEQRQDVQQREPEQRRDGQQGKPEQTPQRDQEQRREPAQERQGQPDQGQRPSLERNGSQPIPNQEQRQDVQQNKPEQAMQRDQERQGQQPAPTQDRGPQRDQVQRGAGMMGERDRFSTQQNQGRGEGVKAQQEQGTRKGLENQQGDKKGQESQSKGMMGERDRTTDKQRDSKTETQRTERTEAARETGRSSEGWSR